MIWRGWKVGFPYNSERRGKLLWLRPQWSNSTDTGFGERRKRLKVWYSKTTKYTSPYLCVIPKTLKTKSDKLKYSFYRQGWWRPRLLNTYIGEHLLPPVPELNKNLSIEGVKEIFEPDQLICNLVLKNTENTCKSVMAAGRQACLSLEWWQKELQVLCLPSDKTTFCLFTWI